MPLSDAPVEPTTPVLRWQATWDFVTRCRVYAVAELARRHADGRRADEWESYLRFTDHTLRELQDGRLDHWFEEPMVPPPESAAKPSVEKG